jgi:hypothetical protein
MHECNAYFCVLSISSLTSWDVTTIEENDELDCRFTEEEIKEEVFGSYVDGAPGPDGLSFMFY